MRPAAAQVRAVRAEKYKPGITVEDGFCDQRGFGWAGVSAEL